jgi:hypothetical protein
MLEVTFTGDVHDPELAKLRASLGMAKRGRLSDDWDNEFGWRELSPRDSGWIYLILTRDLERDGWWEVDLEYEQDPLPVAEVDTWAQKITSAITAAGLTVQEVKR